MTACSMICADGGWAFTRASKASFHASKTDHETGYSALEQMTSNRHRLIFYYNDEKNRRA